MAVTHHGMAEAAIQIRHGVIVACRIWMEVRGELGRECFGFVVRLATPGRWPLSSLDATSFGVRISAIAAS